MILVVHCCSPKRAKRRRNLHVRTLNQKGQSPSPFGSRPLTLRFLTAPFCALLLHWQSACILAHLILSFLINGSHGLINRFDNQVLEHVRIVWIDGFWFDLPSNSVAYSSLCAACISFCIFCICFIMPCILPIPRMFHHPFLVIFDCYVRCIFTK